MKTIMLWVVIAILGLAGSAWSWERTYGGIYPDVAYSITKTSDGNFMFTGDTCVATYGPSDDRLALWVVKIDINGDVLWSTSDTTLMDEGLEITALPDGNSIICGFSGSYASKIVQIDTLGDTIWTRTPWTSGSYSAKAWGIAYSAEGDYLVVGSARNWAWSDYLAWAVKYDLRGDTIWTNTWYDSELSTQTLRKVISTTEGGFVAVGAIWAEWGFGNWDAWVVRLTAAGDSFYSWQYGGYDLDKATCIITTLDGGYLVAGMTYSFGSGGSDAWLIKMDNLGDTTWTRTFGGIGDEWVNAVLETSDGGILLVGASNSYSSGDLDAWIMKTNRYGDSLWAGTYGGTSDDEFLSATAPDDGGFLLCGYTMSFGSGSYDAYLVKVDSLGNSASANVQNHELAFSNTISASCSNLNLLICIKLEKATHVRLDVLNCLGQRQYCPVDLDLPQGETNLGCPFPNLTAGVYIIQSNGTLPVTRIVVVK